MFFKLKTAVLVLILMVCFCIPILQAAELIPLPQDALKISEYRSNSGPIKKLIKNYETSISTDKLVEFYKKELQKNGWINKEGRVYIKDDNLALIAFGPKNDKTGKNSFSILTCKVPSSEDFSAMRKKNPDKLNFMPIYPGSEQVSFWDSDRITTAEYETKDNVKDVAFFYKSRMLNYGWKLINQTSKSTKAILEFQRKDNETCEIIIEKTDKTIISVVYHIYARPRL